ncbi:hypothetical protein, partial [Escherichia coli]|uniref:hypothetical protein n=1 Tax=Escherichia coli TaxID=562 RepID=UPI001C55E21D
NFIGASNYPWLQTRKCVRENHVKTKLKQKKYGLCCILLLCCFYLTFDVEFSRNDVHGGITNMIHNEKKLKIHKLESYFFSSERLKKSM